jgi:hypothetical protein
MNHHTSSHDDINEIKNTCKTGGFKLLFTSNPVLDSLFIHIVIRHGGPFGESAHIITSKQGAMKDRTTKGETKEEWSRKDDGVTSSTFTSTDEDLSQAMRQSLAISDNGQTLQTNKKSSNGGTVLQPIYIPTASGNDTWELTWPIWHLLPTHERKEIARQNGFRNIGDFEEEVILSRALNEEETKDMQVARNDNLLGRREQTNPLVKNSQTVVQQKERYREDSSEREDDNDEEDVDSIVSTDEDSQLIEEGMDSKDKDENVEVGGYILLLPDELILHHIFPYLPTEYFAACALVSPHWKGFTRSELAYKELCKRSYLNQSKRKALHVARFGGSYRTMLEKRFRVKTGCGLYILKCTKIKKVSEMPKF